MNYLSVCSGIEAATLAWKPLGWHAVAFAEIEKFPAALLAHHYPDTPNLGDMTRFKEWPDATVDLLVGGTPCQSFSVAGLRKGMADPRGNLALTYLAIADRYRPEWLVWENVPGVLSSNGGRDFGAIVGGMVELGYSPCWRVLDAQYVRVDGLGRAVPQRRRRVFVVGHLGGWRRSAAVLFDPESLSGNSPPRREARKEVAGTLGASLRGGGGLNSNDDGGLIPERHRADVAATLDCSFAEKYGQNDQHINAGASLFVEVALPVIAGNQRNDPETETLVAHALRADGFDASEDGTGRGTPLVPIAFGARDHGGDYEFDLSPTLRAGGFDASHANGGAMPAVSWRWGVRRLTPTECERLQGMPDGYTLIPFRGKPAADGPRYKALGNSMAVNVMRWIGRRIELVRSL